MIKAVLLHLCHNPWSDWIGSDVKVPYAPGKAPDQELRCRDSFWRMAVDHAAERRLNAVVVDIGEGLSFPSHPELAIKGSWSPEKLRAELARMRKLGLEPIPKLNFSASHDSWLKDYHLMLSTSRYYDVCRDLIHDVCEIFDSPRLFHLGWDEETIENGAGCHCAIARQGELWWHDMLYTVRCVEDCGVRAWIWSDHAWFSDPANFFRRCPKSVLQSNWYYDNRMAGFDIMQNKTPDRVKLETFLKLEEAGFEQVPCGSNWRSAEHVKAGANADYVMGNLARFARANISPARFAGLMMAPWAWCTDETNEWGVRHIDCILQGIDQLARATEEGALT